MPGALRHSVAIVCVMSASAVSAAVSAPSFDTAPVEQFTGANGKLDASEGVFKVSLQPRVMFLHYWGVRRAAELARGLRAALDGTSVR
jgi:hypothetical protein